MSSDSLDQSALFEAKTSVSLFALFRFATTLELSLNVIGLVAAIAAGSATPFMSLFFGNIINSFVEIGRAGSDPQRDRDHLASVTHEFRRRSRQNAVHLVYLGLGTFVSTFFCVSIWAYTGERMARRIRERYFEAVVHQDISFYDDTTAGEVATRIEIDAHLVQQGISEKFALVASYSSSFVTGLAIAYSRSWRLSLALSAMLPCILLVGAFITIISARYSKSSLGHLSKAGGVAQESLSTIRTVHAFSAESSLSALYDSFIQQAHTVDVKFSGILGVGMAVFSFIVYSSYSLSFYYGTVLLLNGHANAGTVVTVGLSVLIGSFSLAIVGPNIEAVMHARESAARLYSAIDRTPLIDSRSITGQRPFPVLGQITFLDVSFKYPSRNDVSVLEHLNLSFSAGKTSALVGFSGSGKSTIVSLIERFYDPTSGTVFLDGVGLPELNTKWLRSQIGLVSQEPILFAGTIHENVALGLLGTAYEGAATEITLDRIREACIKALAHEFIVSFPNGYETFVGDGGMRLSGGQKQRIAIARAIVSNPKILLLDEATSALDTQSEGIVQAALTQASEGRTTIAIAHRLSTVKDADVIYVLGNGKVIEQGTHDELIEARNGTYAQLVRTQHLEQEANEADETSDGFGNAGVAVSKGHDAPKYSFPSPGASEQQPAPVAAMKGMTLLREMGSFIPDTSQLYAWGTLFGCLGGLVYPAFGIVYAKAVRGFEASNVHDIRTAGTRSALWLFLIAVGSTLSLAIHNLLFGKAAVILTTRLRSASFKALLSKEVAFFDMDKNNPGTLMANLIGGPEKIKGFASMTLGAILQCTSCCIGGAVIGLIFGWKLSLVGIGCMPPIVAMGFIRLQLVAAKEKSTKQAHNESAQIACEAVVAIKTVAALCCEDYSCSLYGAALGRSLKYSFISTTLSHIVFAMSLSVILFAVALMFWYGSTLVASGEYSTFQFYVCFMSTTFACWNASNVFLSVPDFSSAIDAAREVITLLRSGSAKPEHDDSSFEKSIDVQGPLRFQDVSFRYPSRPEVLVLRNFSISITPGSYVAFVGPSGSGKSTIIQLIERFYEPSSGQIYLDDKPLSHLSIDKYRRSVSLVSQDSRLYSGTIQFNVLLGSVKDPEQVSDAEIEEACRLANILDFVKSLPLGFETQVGEKGSQLSGGQKQRIAIARALIRNPKLLLLDEATSALDANSEAVVQEALNNAVVGKTTIAVAHRLSTIQHADCIYFIDGGTIIEYGTHGQLLARRGAYYRLAQLQELRD